ncbi:MAG: multicopper oxidase domain-containing protein [Pseudomonadota bacterium]
MVKRRELFKIGAATTLLGQMDAKAQLVFPDGFRMSMLTDPSPPVTPFVAPLNIMPVAQPVNPHELVPGPDPLRHQRYNEFKPRKFYVQHLTEFKHVYHPEGPYANGSWAWGFNGMTPGETFHVRYGEPIFVRRFNDLPQLGQANVRFALPSSSIHLHNGHTASESDGIPQDFTNPGEFWDHHYASIYAGMDQREAMGTLWYHDHRLDFTGPNVYAGLTGFYLLFDDLDSGNERDPNPHAFRLPSGKYDVPLILHDVKFDQNGQPVWDFFNPEPSPSATPSEQYTTTGMLGDRFTVNRGIQPYFKVEARKYRLRVLNGGPSRFYELSLRKKTANGYADSKVKFHVISNDGNLLPRPLYTDGIRVAVAQRHDIIVDFSQFKPGDQLYLVNQLEMREDGAGPTGRNLANGDLIMRFDVEPSLQPDLSRIPARLRELPPINMDEVRRERVFNFDYDNGLWTINGKLMDPNRVDAKIEKGSAEIWTWRNGGNAWSHPIHTHFEEFQILEINGKPIPADSVLHSRKDVIELGPNDEVKFFSRWRDFEGKHVMHCHNVVHEDHAMMIRWDIVPPGQGD